MMLTQPSLPNTSTSVIPGDMDAVFILAQVNSPNHSGWALQPDGTKMLTYHPSVQPQVVTLIDNYETEYLEKKRKPDARRQIGAMGRDKAATFTFGGQVFPLDFTTECRLDGLCRFFDRNPDVAEIHWDTTGEGDFLTIPRDIGYAMFDAATHHMQATFNRRKELTDLVNACTTFEELDALDLTTGWPGGPE